MQRYREFQPTSFDARGLNGDEHGISEWFVAPVIQTRDSGPLEHSNFASFLRKLGGEGDTVQVHRFGHWGPGWFEIIVVDPSDEARVELAQGLSDALEDYPVVDEEDYSTREYEAACEYWAQMSTRERVDWIQRKGRGRVSVFAARRDEVPQGLEISELAE